MPDNEVIEFDPNKLSPQSSLLKIFPICPVCSTLAKRNNQRPHERTTLYQTTRLAYEHSQRLQALIRPLLPQTTWREANKLAWRSGQTLPTETREMSILRLDIANFTKLMDSHPLDQVLADLNTYLDLLVPLIHNHHGDVNKYLGDGFLAVFAEADEAVQAGCALQQAIAGFNREQTAQGRLVFPTRIGIDSGPVALTNLGASNRQDRTVMGNPVNLAERIQAQATPGRVWLSQATFDLLEDQSGCCCLGSIEVKGRAEPVVVYEAL